MARDLTTAAANSLAAPQVRMLVFVEMDFPSGFARFNNSGVTIAWAGYDWIGAGNVVSIDPVSEGISLDARGLSFTLTGVPGENIAAALGQQYQGRSCKLWAAPLDESYVPVSDPVLVFWGRMDVMTVELGATATITVSAESRLADWDRPRVRRYNYEDQQIDYPGDKGFEFVPQMVEKELRWGY